MQRQVVDVVQDGLRTDALRLVIGINVLAVLANDLLRLVHVGRLALVPIVDVLDDQQVHLADLLPIGALQCPLDAFC